MTQRGLTSRVRAFLADTTAVIWISLALSAAIVLAGLLVPNELLSLTTWLRDLISAQLGWYYLLLVSAILFFCLFLILSPIGRIHLGEPDSVPEHSRGSWIAMLFSAGMGIGLIFYGAYEPLSHYALNAPEAEVGSLDALRDAMKYSFFHWGFSAWAIYGVVALALAYFTFRKKERALLSVTLKPLFGARMDGPAGRIVDATAEFATVISVAASLGFGAMQIAGGLNFLFGVPRTPLLEIAIVVVATALYVASATSGVNSGVKLLSNLNMVLAAALVCACLLLGPTSQIMNAMVSAVGAYLQDLVRMSFRAAAYDVAQHAWIERWTVFYWAWWLAGAPFTGAFIARVSRGRTIREFLLTVIVVPSVVGMVWFSTMGTLSTGAEIGGAGVSGLAVEEVLFGTLAQYPLGPALSIVAIALVFSFFVTSADSATYVMGSLSEGGSLRPHRPTLVVCGLLVSLIATILLLGGGLDALQNVVIIFALPFSVVVLLMMVALYRELDHERRMMGLFITPDAVPERGRPYRSYEDGDPRRGSTFGRPSSK